jgi:hypothetical protein
MENADKVKHKTQRESLLNNQAIIRQSLELATIHCDVPVKLDLDQLKFREPDRTAAYELFRELEFNLLTKEFSDSAPLFDSLPDDGREHVTSNIRSIVHVKSLDKLIRTLWEKEWFAFGVMTRNEAKWHSSFDKVPPRGISISYAPASQALSTLRISKAAGENAIGPLADIFSNPYIDKSTHDLKCKLAIFAKMGIRPKA